MTKRDSATCTAIAALVCCTLLPGCAARREAQAAAREKLPAVKTVCLKVSGIDGEELALLRKRADNYLRESKFELGTQQCDATVSFVKMGGDKGVIYNIPGWFGPVSRANWSVEGTYTLTRNGVVERDSETINTRDHYTNVALLEWLADALVQPIREAYKPAP